MERSKWQPAVPFSKPAVPFSIIFEEQLMVGTVRNHAVFQNGLRVKSAMKAGSVLLYWMEMFITLECVIIMEDA